MRAHMRDCVGCKAFEAAIPSRTAELDAVVPILAAPASADLLARILARGAHHRSAAAGAGAAAGPGAPVGSGRTDRAPARLARAPGGARTATPNRDAGGTPGGGALSVGCGVCAARTPKWVWSGGTRAAHACTSAMRGTQAPGWGRRGWNWWGATCGGGTASGVASVG